MENKRNRVACYARYSSSQQREESISAQLRAMRKYCKDNAFEIVATYVDEAFSATTDKRPQFQQMISDSAEKLFDIVLVHKLDRFARNRYDSSLYKQKLRRNGVRVCSVLERLDNSPESILLEGLLESINEFYSANLARETMKGLRENALKCQYNGGCAGLGYDIDDSKHFVINELEARAVVMIYSMYLSGYSYKAIAETLNAEGYRSKNGNQFCVNSFDAILRNERYTGVYIFNRAAAKDFEGKRNNHKNKSDDEIIRIEGGVPAIISRDIWNAAQEKRKSNVGGNGNAKTMYLLSGKIKCGCCGKTMRGSVRIRKRKPSYHMYTCCTYESECTNIKEIERDSLEEYIINLVLENISENDRTELLNADRNSVVFRTLLQKHIQQVTVLKRKVAITILADNTAIDYSTSRKQFQTPTKKRKTKK